MYRTAIRNTWVVEATWAEGRIYYYKEPHDSGIWVTDIASATKFRIKAEAMRFGGEMYHLYNGDVGFEVLAA